MTLIKKIYSILISMKLMLLLIFLFAAASGIATFIENDHGINTSWALVYSTCWFEAVQVLLGISIIGNIFKYKMYTKKKIPTFIFHIAFLFVLLGSGITRYYGYEGVMHIREGATEHRMLSSDAFLQVGATKNDKKYYEEEIVYISALGGREFKTTLDVDGKDITVKYKKFIDKAVKTAVEDENGVPIVSFVITTPQGPEKFFLKSGDFIDLGPLAIYFDKEPTGEAKPILRLINNNGNISFVSNVQINWMKMADRSEGLYNVGREYPFEAKKLYNINGIQLVSKAVLAKGKVTVIDEDTYKSTASMNMKFDSLSALVVDVEYDGIHKEVALMGSGKRFKGYTENIKIADTEIALEWGSKIIELPFSLRLRDFMLIKYPGSMSPSSYESHVTLIDKQNLVRQEHRIYMNNVLDYGGYLFFQSSYDKDEKGTILSVNHDPGKWPTYFGYTLLAIGLFLNFFNPNGRFGKLARTKYEYKAGVTAALLMFFSLFNAQTLTASTELIEQVKNIDAEHAEHYGTLLVQSRDGRIKPIDSFAIELLNKISSKDSMFGLSHNQILLGMASNPDVWKQIDMIKVAHPKVSKLLGVDESKKRFAYNDAFDRNGQYKLGELAEEALRKRSAIRDMFDKEIIKVDERVNVAYMIYSGRFMTVFPLKGDETNKWYYPEEALQGFPPEASKEVLTLLRNNSMGLVNGINRGTWEEANKAIDDIKEYQKKYSPSIIPDSMLIEAELLYNKMNIFDKLYPIYLLAGLILLVLIFVRLAKPNINIEVVTRIVLGVFVVAFVIHTMNLGLRWYIAGHAPWSNGYEAMLYISWTIILAGILFARSSELAVATTGIFAGITLFVAHLSWLNPQITTLVPVLKSYWLTIHVSIITASYGFLGLSTLLGFVVLIFYIMLSSKDKREQISVNIFEATRISEMSMIVGLSLLTVGNFLGGVWANESWGRYWGWDPKETWALITILVYVFVIHMRFVPALKSNFVFTAASVVAYSSVIMTYFGVNYYLSGLHSYAAGDPVPVPEWIYYVISVIIILIVSASFNRNKLVKIKPIKQ
ncbi:cytochrome c biogenesis protein CcsA [Candidatus Sulfurimonas baltica]|uniref:Cytochrome c biogenesis protein CcsA n=1 Tax=Candidatus Sulfurimonas baltica TaxID=2740404 RepID=A0A7S7LV58_9BACT|nr:cytochrome c biogenesis protein CcsA [Candidatus Sulfurimonas baltica]QOY51862.1 cytochrome c biogenesis protein CcsA [Candidatus Sulfurimonas baltica]